VAVGGTLNQPAPGVLGNDIDPENDPLTVTTTPVTPPAHGSLTLHADGSYTYIHDGSETVTDSFVYQACDPGPRCDTATVVLSVVPVTQLPVAGDDTYMASEDTALEVPVALGVLVNDMVPDGDPLTAVLNTGPAHGTLDLRADGSFSYTPAAHFIGRDTFTYRAHDGAIGSNVATVRITVTGRVYLPLTMRNW